MGRLQTARLENFIRRWGSIKGGGSVLSETLGDVFPVLDLENLTPENQLVAGWTLWAGGASVTGTAGDLAALSLINPADSGQIVVVDKMTFFASAAQVCQYGINSTLLTQVIAVSVRDSRVGQVFGGAALVGASQDTTGNLGDINFRVLNTEDLQFEIPNAFAVLTPGNQLQVTMSTVATTLRGAFFGRSRLAEPSELSF